MIVFDRIRYNAWISGYLIKYRSKPKESWGYMKRLKEIEEAQLKWDLTEKWPEFKRTKEEK